jgi:hypothetical protein
MVLGIATAHLPVPVVDRIASTMRHISISDLRSYGVPAPVRPYSEFLRRREVTLGGTFRLVGIQAKRLAAAT